MQICTEAWLHYLHFEHLQGVVRPVDGSRRQPVAASLTHLTARWRSDDQPPNTR